MQKKLIIHEERQIACVPVEDQVDWAPHVDVNKVAVDMTVLYQLSHPAHLMRTGAADLNAEDVFRHVFLDEGPLRGGALEEGQGHGHLSTRYIGSKLLANAPGNIKQPNLNKYTK